MSQDIPSEWGQPGAATNYTLTTRRTGYDRTVCVVSGRSMLRLRWRSGRLTPIALYLVLAAGGAPLLSAQHTEYPQAPILTAPRTDVPLDSIDRHFAEMAALTAPVECWRWQGNSMRVGGHGVDQACHAELGDTAVYYFRTDNGSYFAAGRSMNLTKGHAHLVSDMTETELRHRYGSPQSCPLGRPEYLFGVQRVLLWPGSDYTITFQSNVGDRASDTPENARNVVDVQIARGRRACGELIDRPSRE
jgi:hypothetical protein